MPFIYLKSSFRSCGNVEKRLDKKAMVNLKIYGNTDWATNDYNTNITQYRKK